MTSSLKSPASSRQNTFIHLILLALAVVGFLSVLAATRWGIGASPDSIVYIAGARNLAAGSGFSMISDGGQAEAITHHAPFYSVMLALLDIGGLDPLSGSRILNGLFFAGSIILVGIILSELTPGNDLGARVAPLIGASLILAPGFMVEIHSMAWSESLFIFLTLLGFWVLSQYLKNRSTGLLVGSAILIALAFLTRYAGAVLVAAGVCSILLFSSWPSRRRLIDGALFGLITVGPLALWLLHNKLTGNTATNRELLVHPINRQQIGWAVTTLGSWFLIPDDSSGVIKLLPYLAILLVVAVVLIAKYRQAGRKKTWLSWMTLPELPFIIRIIVLFIPQYFAFVLISLTFLDANIPLDSRILSPVYVTGVILVIYFLNEGARLLRTPVFLRFAVFGVSFIFVGALTWQSLQYVRTGYADGIGFTGRRWRESPTLALLVDQPKDRLIYSNAPEALYLYTHVTSLAMPKKFESANQRPNDQYDEELSTLKAQIFERSGMIVYFDSMMRPGLPSEQEILGDLNLRLLERTADGMIFGIK